MDSFVEVECGDCTPEYTLGLMRNECQVFLNSGFDEMGMRSYCDVVVVEITALN